MQRDWGSQKTQQLDLLPQRSSNSKVTFFCKSDVTEQQSVYTYNKALVLYIPSSKFYMLFH